MRRITKEMILQAEHNLLSEASMWARGTPEEMAKLGVYNEGARDMASRLLYLLEEDCG